jgi:hypothetical protein
LVSSDQNRRFEQLVQESNDSFPSPIDIIVKRSFLKVYVSKRKENTNFWIYFVYLCRCVRKSLFRYIRRRKNTPLHSIDPKIYKSYLFLLYASVIISELDGFIDITIDIKSTLVIKRNTSTSFSDKFRI